MSAGWPAFEIHFHCAQAQGQNLTSDREALGRNLKWNSTYPHLFAAIPQGNLPLTSHEQHHSALQILSHQCALLLQALPSPAIFSPAIPLYGCCYPYRFVALQCFLDRLVLESASARQLLQKEMQRAQPQQITSACLFLFQTCETSRLAMRIPFFHPT